MIELGIELCASGFGNVFRVRQCARSVGMLHIVSVCDCFSGCQLSGLGSGHSVIESGLNCVCLASAMCLGYTRVQGLWGYFT